MSGICPERRWAFDVSRARGEAPGQAGWGCGRGRALFRDKIILGATATRTDRTAAAPALSRDLISPDLASDVRTHAENLCSSNQGGCLAVVRVPGPMGPTPLLAALESCEK